MIVPVRRKVNDQIPSGGASGSRMDREVQEHPLQMPLTCH